MVPGGAVHLLMIRSGLVSRWPSCSAAENKSVISASPFSLLGVPIVIIITETCPTTDGRSSVNRIECLFS